MVRATGVAMTAHFAVAEVERTAEGEYNGILTDGRLITAMVGTGVLSIEVENPEKEDGIGRYYIGHAEPMREIFVKAIAPEEWRVNAISYDELREHTAGYVIWPDVCVDHAHGASCNEVGEPRAERFAQ